MSYPLQPTESPDPLLYRAIMASFDENQHAALEAGREIKAHPEQLLSETRMLSLVCNISRVAFGILAFLFLGASVVTGTVVAGALAFLCHEGYSFLDKLIEVVTTKREFLGYDGRFSGENFARFWESSFAVTPQIGMMEFKAILSSPIDQTFVLSYLKDDIFGGIDEMTERSVTYS